MFKELFTSITEYRPNTVKEKIKLPKGAIALSYPKDVILDVEDKYGDIVDDYDVNVDKRYITVWFNTDDSKTIEKAMEYIANA